MSQALLRTPTSRVNQSISRETIAEEEKWLLKYSTFKRAFYRQECNFLKNYMHSRMQQSDILQYRKRSRKSKCKKHLENYKKFTKRQTQACTPRIYCRNKLTYTSVDNSTTIAEFYEDQFIPKWVPGIFPGVKCDRGLPRLRNGRA
jgi:hypothetical protein